MASDVYSLGVYYNISLQPGMSVFHFKADEENSANPDNDAHLLIQGFIDTLEDLWLACIPASVGLLGYKARRVNNSGGPGISVARSEKVGARGDEFASAAVGPTLVWSYKQLDNKWRAGRTFVPAVADSDISFNVFSPSLLTACQNFISAMLTVPTIEIGTPDITFEFGIFSPTHASFSGAEAGQISGKPGIQNRRMKPTF
jgi:hypothetical protein